MADPVWGAAARAQKTRFGGDLEEESGRLGPSVYFVRCQNFRLSRAFPRYRATLAQYHFGCPPKYSPRQLMGHGLVIPADSAPFNVHMITGSLWALVHQVLPAVFLP